MTIERIFVAGTGLMGHGIAQVHAATGLEVVMYEPDLSRAQAGGDRIAANLERAVAKGRLEAADRDATLARISATDDQAAVRDADLVIEAVFEDIEVKTALWRELDPLAPARCHLRHEHELDLDRPARRGGLPGAPRALRRDAFLQPGPGHAADRADPRARRPSTPRKRPSASWPNASASRSSSRRIGPGSSSTGS